MEEKKEVCDYNNTIREMIKHENEIRNQRTNWFLVIQGFLIAGAYQIEHESFLQVNISIVGVVTSISFAYAAWRSSLAINYAYACWKSFLEDKKESGEDYPPISLITKEIIEIRYPQKEPVSSKERLLKFMYPENCLDLRLGKCLNYCDCLLPYKTLPVLFLMFWIVVLVLF